MDCSPLLHIVPMDELHAESICSWRYPEPYEQYNWQSWQDMQASSCEFGDAQIRAEQYVAILNHTQELIGFAQFFPMLGVTRLGFGMHPDYCGDGNGACFTRVIVEEAKKRAPNNEIDLEVFTWNHRAYKAYQKAGFVHTDTYERPSPDGSSAVHCMVFRAT